MDSNMLCYVHQQLPVRKVAFEGRNTGRRFLTCAVEDVSSINFGVVFLHIGS